MRVLLVTGSFPYMHCGVGDYTHRLAHALAKAPGVRVTVLTSVQAAVDPVSTVRVLPLMTDWSLKRLSTAAKAIKDVKPDVVHIQYPTQGYAPKPATESMIPLIARALGARVVRTWHEPPDPRSRWFFVQSLVPGPLIYTRPTFPDALPRYARRLLKDQGVLIPIASNMPQSTLSGEKRDVLRKQYLNGRKRMILFFGFLYPAKGAELLFEIACPDTDRLVFAGARPDADYYREIQARSKKGPWNDSAAFPGYLSDAEVADLIAAADAIVLPFRGGGGAGNGTIHAARLQGTPVITTSTSPQGYDAENNVYWARIDDVAEMRSALDRWGGHRRSPAPQQDDWKRIADAHLSIYQAATGKMSS